MPTSTGIFIPAVLAEIERIRPASVLDVGCGFGLWGFLCRLYLDVFEGRPYRDEWTIRIEGVEIFRKYIMPHQEFLYDRIHIGRIENYVDELDGFDLYIFGDVLEHLPKKDGLSILSTAYSKSNKGILINIPIGEGWLREGTDDNPHEAHVSIWDFDDFVSYSPKICGEASLPNVGRYACLLLDKTFAEAEKAGLMVSNGRLLVEINPEAALSFFKSATDLGYGSPDAHLEIANLLLQQKKVDETVDILRQAIDRFPEHAETYDILSKVLQLSNRLAEAREVMAARPSPATGQ